MRVYRTFGNHISPWNTHAYRSHSVLFKTRYTITNKYISSVHHCIYNIGRPQGSRTLFTLHKVVGGIAVRTRSRFNGSI